MLDFENCKLHVTTNLGELIMVYKRHPVFLLFENLKPQLGVAIEEREVWEVKEKMNNNNLCYWKPTLHLLIQMNLSKEQVKFSSPSPLFVPIYIYVYILLLNREKEAMNWDYVGMVESC